MGRQLCMRTLPGDLTLLEEELRSRNAIFLAYRHVGPTVEARSTISCEGNADPIVWLVRGEDHGTVQMRHLETQGHWLVDQLRSPVVELSRRMDGEGSSAARPTQGRLYFDLGFYDGDQPVEFSQEFVTWADGILAAVRQAFARDPRTGCYDGPRAREWLATAG